MTRESWIGEGGPRRMRSVGLGRHFLKSALALALAAVGIASAGMPASALTYYSSPPFPTGRLLTTRPSLRWKVWPVEPYRVRAVHMSLNGRPVPARYAVEDRTAVSVPDEPLVPGEYAVRCVVVLNDGEPLEREWQFVVAPAALFALPEPDREPQRALDAANGYRRLMGLPDLVMESSLCASADAHSRYLDTNREFGHYEVPGHHDFTGRDLLERNTAFGFWGGGYEDVAYGSSRPETAISLLFDAPYHRLPFMQPGAPSFGMGRVGRQVTLEFGLTGEAAVVVYPAAGQTGVPLDWSGNEDPNPLRIHGTGGRTGYVITYAYFCPDQDPIRVQQATLRAPDGREVRCFVNSPANDSRLQNGVFLIPEEPLQPQTTYTADVRAANADGTDISRRWSFKTKPGTVEMKPSRRTRS